MQNEKLQFKIQNYQMLKFLNFCIAAPDFALTDDIEDKSLVKV